MAWCGRTGVEWAAVCSGWAPHSVCVSWVCESPSAYMSAALTRVCSLLPARLLLLRTHTPAPAGRPRPSRPPTTPLQRAKITRVPDCGPNATARWPSVAPSVAPPWTLFMARRASGPGRPCTAVQGEPKCRSGGRSAPQQARAPRPPALRVHRGSPPRQRDQPTQHLAPWPTQHLAPWPTPRADRLRPPARDWTKPEQTLRQFLP